MIASWSRPELGALAEIVRERTGLTFTDDRRAEVEAAFARALSQMGASHELDERVLDALLEELVIGETYFFRDRAIWNLVESVVLPDLLARSAEAHVLRFWSAGCASGEETWSLAMLLHRAGLAGRSRVLGTDLSARALARARQGVYRAWSIRADGGSLAMPYLLRDGELFRVHDALRASVTFARVNLLSSSWPPIGADVLHNDVVLCRNVLIYLDPASVERAAERLRDALNDGGWLITAGSDPPLQHLPGLEPVVHEHGVVYRRSIRLRSPRRVSRPDLRRISSRSTEEVPRRPSADGIAATRRPTPSSGAPLVTAPKGPEAPPPQGLADGVARVRALAQTSLSEASRVCHEALARAPLHAELHHVHAEILLLEGLEGLAEHALRRALYLDPKLVVARFALGAVLAARGEIADARRAFRLVRELCDTMSPTTLVRLAEGRTAAELARAAAAQIGRLDPTGASVP